MGLALPIVENKSILTETSGFLGDGFTHTINAYFRSLLGAERVLTSRDGFNTLDR